ncbi:methyltransferase domain-containing protein [Mucilaginibacter ximonensis]|uniref:Methyltransferase domain-containing protein n=1 Tax=Mucilaginibacter ximonensis TaxID=538021 RepID=A0ABW5YF09_9SPHI
MLKNIAVNISTKNRQKKYQYFLKQLQPNVNTRILDVGFTNDEPYPGINFLERNYPFLHNITALGIEDAPKFKENFPEVKVVMYDGSFFPFADKSFDIAWSNAVIEHVGGYDKQLLFLSELLRSSKDIFITTPNRWFPVEVHTRLPFLHYLPKKIFDKVLKLIGKDWASGDYMNLLSVADMKKMLKRLNVDNYIIKRNRKFGVTMDFVLIVKQ